MNLGAWSRIAIPLAFASVLGSVAVVPLWSTQLYWHVNSLKATILINPDSSLLVDETLVIPEIDPHFGLRCLIPIGSDDRFDRTYNPGYTDDNGLRVKVQKVTVDGTHCHPERSRSACFAGNSAQSRDLGFAFSVLNQSP